MHKIIKTVLIFTLVATPLLFAKQTYAHVAPATQIGVVEGLVSGPDNGPLAAATVDVTCNSVVLNTTSDTNGYYTVQFDNGVCTQGKTVNVSATKNSMTGNGTGIMQSYGDFGMLHLDIAIVHVPVVPEFSLITGLMTLAASAGSIVFLRKKV